MGFLLFPSFSILSPILVLLFASVDRLVCCRARRIWLQKKHSHMVMMGSFIFFFLASLYFFPFCPFSLAPSWSSFSTSFSFIQLSFVFFFLFLLLQYRTTTKLIDAGKTGTRQKIHPRCRARLTAPLPCDSRGTRRSCASVCRRPHTPRAATAMSTPSTPGDQPFEYFALGKPAAPRRRLRRYTGSSHLLLAPCTQLAAAPQRLDAAVGAAAPLGARSPFWRAGGRAALVRLQNGQLVPVTGSRL